MKKLFTHVTRVIVNLSIGFSVLTMGISGPSFSSGRFAWAIGNGPIGQNAQAQTGNAGTGVNLGVANPVVCNAAGYEKMSFLKSPSSRAYQSPPPDTDTTESNEFYGWIVNNSGGKVADIDAAKKLSPPEKNKYFQNARAEFDKSFNTCLKAGAVNSDSQLQACQAATQKWDKSRSEAATACSKVGIKGDVAGCIKHYNRCQECESLEIPNDKLDEEPELGECKNPNKDDGDDWITADIPQTIDLNSGAALTPVQQQQNALAARTVSRAKYAACPQLAWLGSKEGRDMLKDMRNDEQTAFEAHQTAKEKVTRLESEMQDIIVQQSEVAKDQEKEAKRLNNQVQAAVGTLDKDLEDKVRKNEEQIEKLVAEANGLPLAIEKERLSKAKAENEIRRSCAAEARKAQLENRQMVQDLMKKGQYSAANFGSLFAKTKMNGRKTNAKSSVFAIVEEACLTDSRAGMREINSTYNANINALTAAKQRIDTQVAAAKAETQRLMTSEKLTGLDKLSKDAENQREEILSTLDKGNTKRDAEVAKVRRNLELAQADVTKKQRRLEEVRATNGTRQAQLETQNEMSAKEGRRSIKDEDWIDASAKLASVQADANNLFEACGEGNPCYEGTSERFVTTSPELDNYRKANFSRFVDSYGLLKATLPTGRCRPEYKPGATSDGAPATAGAKQ